MDDSTDFYADLEAPQGTDLVVLWEIVPLDLTGCTASAITDLGTFAVTLTMSTEGDDTVTTFAWQIPNSTLAAAAKGLYAWKVQVTFPTLPATVLQYGHGNLLVI